ncbi:hypothetical protein CVN56_01310 [Rhodococcus sp. AQ5-07]|nr:hypothetical protein CVN56_01310 [Rhodococcus sp. AQ5-07]
MNRCPDYVTIYNVFYFLSDFVKVCEKFEICQASVTKNAAFVLGLLGDQERLTIGCRLAFDEGRRQRCSGLRFALALDRNSFVCIPASTAELPCLRLQRE